MPMGDDGWHHVREIADLFHDLYVKAAGVVTDYVGVEYERGHSTDDFKLHINPLDIVKTEDST